MATEEKMPVSFGFTKKTKVKILEKNPPNNDDTEFVLALECKEVKSVKPKVKEAPLVIPLIKCNNYGLHGNRTANTDGKTSKKDMQSAGSETRPTAGDKTTVDSLENVAVREVLKEAAQYNNDWDERGQKDLNLTIPLLMQNRVPEGYETDDKLDVSIRPDEATGADYSQVPIQQFGLAMLRGMGWKEGEGIGAKMKKVVKPVDAILRPKGQGLGANRKAGNELDLKKNGKLKKIVNEPKEFSKGVGVLVNSGAHKNLYGKIEGVDVDNARLVIKLAISSQLVTISQFGVEIVENDDYKKYSRDLSRFSKGRMEHSKEDREHDHIEQPSGNRAESHMDGVSSKHNSSRDSRKSRNSDMDSSRRGTKGSHDRVKGTQREKQEYRSDEKKRKIDSSYDRLSPHQRSCEDTAEAGRQTTWLRPDLRVRFVDKLYKNGRYYNSKVTIVDVVTTMVCSCQTRDGKILEDVNQSMVETLIPRAEMSCVMVVAGQFTGQLASLVKRDKSKQTAEVQLLRNRDQIVRLDYGDICEYAGNLHDEEDY